MRYFTGVAGTPMTAALRNLIVLAIALVLGLGLWLAAIPIASAARDMTATEMLQSKLPRDKTLTSASKTEVLDAVCGAVASWRAQSPQIVRTAVTTRHEFAGDIVTIAVRCLRDDKDGPLACERVAEIYRFAVDGNPRGQAAILESFLMTAPDCRGSFAFAEGKQVISPPAEGPDIRAEIGNFTNTPTNINPPSGTIAGGGFNPTTNQCVVCHNAHDIQIPCNQVSKYLNNHRGDFAGACQPTPITNR
jgi:hypothetical protein